MSNSRRLPGTRAPGVKCGSCGHRIGAGADRIRLRDGREICMYCRDRNVLAARLPCGHVGMPGVLVISDSADLSNFQCIRCSPHANLPRGYPGTSEKDTARGRHGAGLPSRGAT